MFREIERDRGIPWSGLVFALAGLTRPEAPMYAGIPMLFLGKRFFSKQNLLRGTMFAAPLAMHILWRHSYYGSVVPRDTQRQNRGSQGAVSRRQGLHPGMD